MYWSACISTWASRSSRAQGARHLDHLGDGGIAADRDRDLAALGAGALDGAADGLADRLGIDDGLLVDGVLGRGLGRIGLHPVLATRPSPAR